MTKVPDSFKTMSFPKPRDGVAAVYAPLPIATPSKTITSTEAERRNLQYKEMKKFINNERCPVCSGQLDGPIGFDAATVYCRVGGDDEYKARYVYGNILPDWSRITLYTTHFAFEIESQHITEDMFLNHLYKLDLSLNPRYQQRSKKELLKYEGSRLMLKANLTEEQLLNKIKLFTLFS